jgi:hypothetical protein
VTFQGNTGFGGVTFQGGAQFSGVIFKGPTWFHWTIFKDPAWFEGATFKDLIWFEGARFEQARQLGPLLVYGVLRLDGAHFAQSIQIEVACRGLSCQRTSFPAGVRFRLRGAQIVLDDDADLSGPSILAGITALSSAQLAKREQRLVQAVRRLAPQAAVELSARPRLLSVQGANIAGLTVSNVDLAECRFAGAHNLDRLRLETEVTFSAAPVRLPWDRRGVIAEERAWRAARSERWATPQWWPAWLHTKAKPGCWTDRRAFAHPWGRALSRGVRDPPSWRAVGWLASRVGGGGRAEAGGKVERPLDERPCRRRGPAQDHEARRPGQRFGDGSHAPIRAPGVGSA